MSNLVSGGKDLISFDQSKLDLIRNVVAKDLTPDEFELFISVAKARGLDPVLGQIHAVKRGDGQGTKKMVLQVAIDGGRLIAARTGEYAGSDTPVFSKDESGGLVASVTIYRMIQGQRVPFTGVAYWDEFYPGEKQGFMWKKMPRTMLAKCAEMQALRKGFPNDLGSMYAPEELEREVVDVSSSDQSKGALSTPPDDALAKRITDILAKFRKLNVTSEMICGKFSLESALQLSETQLKELNEIGAAIVNKRISLEEAFKPAEKWESA